MLLNNQNHTLTVSELAHILGLSVGTVKNKLENYQLTEFVHKSNFAPPYAVDMTDESIELIKKIIVPHGQMNRAFRCLKRFETWLETGVIE